jgi:predicted DNA-binding protein (UPF0251 family)
MLFSLVDMGKLDISEASEILGVSEDEFVSKMEKAGFKVPVMA